ncbi:hypothetical protein [uncultured Ruegeria sp.]|uniref:hypothetical protein n=1 Tax=uncultured Ruegeria sp. TaxID=259304 RepID=UPI00262E39E7|nr:hypothetical protein [uncultured Ruegeria sp.]
MRKPKITIEGPNIFIFGRSKYLLPARIPKTSFWSARIFLSTSHYLLLKRLANRTIENFKIKIPSKKAETMFNEMKNQVTPDISTPASRTFPNSGIKTPEEINTKRQISTVFI